MTKPVTACMILAAAACSCNGPAGTAKTAAGAADRAEEIMEAFREEVRREIYPVYDELTAEEIMTKIDEIAGRCVRRKLPELVEDGKSKYLALPEAELDLSDYEPVSAEITRERNEALESFPEWMMCNNVSAVTVRNPVYLAGIFRTRTRPEESDSDFAKRRVLSAFAPPVVYRVGDDVQKPVVLFEEPASRVTVVHMELRDGVLFVPTRVEHLKKK